MNCPVCKRDLAPTLSICFTCGAMVHDSVREELESKVAPVSGSLKATSGELPAISPPLAMPVQEMKAAVRETPAMPEAPKPIQMRIETSDLPIKKTSPTLVDFQIKNPKLPDWRLQLQNSVRQRSTSSGPIETVNIRMPKAQTKTNGANALKVEHTEETEVAEHPNPRIANALKRIENSRKTFLKSEPAKETAKAAIPRSYPFNVVSRSGDIAAPKPEAKPTINPSPRPTLVSSLRIEKKTFDTNKLPPLLASVEGPKIGEAEILVGSIVEPTVLPAIVDEEIVEIESPIEEIETDEIDDLAPISMRVTAGLFDLIIGGFATAILLSPFVVSGGNWLSAAGILAITASAAIVMFLYLTISLAFVGRTAGMRLFSLELVDVEENAYPTLHQSAVSSAVFLLSLAFGGLGFLPIFFNEERRAVHDLLSGTILVREY
jgi:uncharacterized RDD family membrane protein YckC